MATTPSNPIDYLEIGRISVLRKEIDQIHGNNAHGTITTELNKRMSVIDLIPCSFTVPYGTAIENFNAADLKPTIEYTKAIEFYQKVCAGYGLEAYEFLRIYLTDLTTVTDDMQSEYQKNILDETLDSVTSSRIGQMFQTKYNLGESLGTNEPGRAESILSQIPSSNLKTIINAVDEVLTHGSRVSFPKIWSNSTFNPNLQCVIKLVSPYGHPKAINEFIIKPLSYLLILLTPSTTNGLTTHRPQYLTLKSYGLSNLTLCQPKAISIRRGGDDTSYNAFKQPLSIEISLQFEAVTEGFACFDDVNNPEEKIFDSTNNIGIKSFEDDFSQPSAIFPTLKSMVNSFRPFGYKEETTTTSQVKTSSFFGPINSEDTVPVLATLATAAVGLAALNAATSNTSPSDISYDPDNNGINFTVPTTSNNIEIQLISDNEETTTLIYDLNSFTPDSYFSGISITNENISLLFNDDYLEDKTYSVKLRDLSGLTPGAWSEDILITSGVSDPNLSVNIYPSSLSYTDNYRWSVENSLGITSGPFLSGYTNSKKFESGDYTLNVVDLAGNTITSKNITISDTFTNSQIYITQQTGNISNINLDTSLQENNFKFILVSDTSQSDFVEKTIEDLTFDDLEVGKYYIIVQYNNSEVSYLNESITNSITIEDNISKSLSITIDDLNLKITDLQVI